MMRYLKLLKNGQGWVSQMDNNKQNKYDSSIITRLESQNDDEIIEALEYLKSDIDIAKYQIDRLLTIFKFTKNFKIKHILAILLHDIGDIKALPILISEITNPFNKTHRGTLIYACEAFNCSEYLDLFITLVQDENYEVAMTCSLVFEAMTGTFNKKLLKENIKKLKEKLNNLNNSYEDCIKDAIMILKTKIQF